MNRAQGTPKPGVIKEPHIWARTVWQRFHPREAAAGTPLWMWIGQTLEGLKRSVNGLRPVNAF